MIKHDGTKCLNCGVKFDNGVRASRCPKCIKVFIIPENKGYMG